MTEEDIRQQIDNLNQLFNVVPCGVSFVVNPKYGHDAVYYPFNRGIVFNMRHLDGVTPSLVAHEFTHHLVYVRHAAQNRLRQGQRLVKNYAKRLRTWDFGYAEEQQAAVALRCKRLPTRRQRQIHHGDDFVMCLKQVIRKTGMDYNTSREYITVARKLKGNK